MMADVIAPWLVSAKVSPPKLFVNACVRQGLLDYLLGAAESRVFFLEAPAGFGKTLLLLQLREKLRERSAYVSWISIAHTDEPDTLVPYLAYAFHQAGLDMSDTGLLSPSFHGVRTSYSLGRLLHHLENCGRQCVLVFDDFENTGDDILKEVLEPLLRMQPENLQLVFACRQNPGLSLSNLAVQGGLVTLDPQRLKFSKSEIKQLFAQVQDTDEIDFILERTGGWPVALQLLRTFGHDATAAAGKMADFSGSNKEVANYFREQLFLKLPEEEQLFLQDTSILDPVWAECADAIRERTDSREIIQRLGYLEGIFAPLENHEDAYRLHPLVREFFCGELQENNPDRYIRLNTSAAHWFTARKKHLEAMRYALGAGDEYLAGEIFEDMGGPRLWMKEGMSRISIGLDLLAGRELKTFPRIHLIRSLRHAKNGEIKKAREDYEYAGQISGRFKHDRPGRDDSVLFIDGFFIETMLVEYGCTPSLRLLKTQALDFILENAAHDWLSRGYARLIQCITHLQAGDFEKSRKFGEAATDDYREGNSIYGELFLYFHFGMGRLAQADIPGALEDYSKGLKIVRGEFPGDKGLQWIGSVLQGELYWEMGDNSNARKHLRSVIKNLSQLEAWFDIYIAAYQSAAEYLLYESGYDAVVTFLDKVRQHAVEQELFRLETVIIATRVSLACIAGEDEQARTYARTLEEFMRSISRADIQSNLREVEAISLARIRVAILNNDIQASRALISELLAIGEKKGHWRMVIYALVQQAILEQANGRQLDAVKLLGRALDLALPGHYIRPFLLECRQLEPALERVLESNISSIKDNAEQQMELVKNILNASANNALDSASSPFTNREMEILSELAGGSPDKVIARTLGLSAHGVRYHLKNIYGKMGVTNRLQAIARAREYGLVK